MKNTGEDYNKNLPIPTCRNSRLYNLMFEPRHERTVALILQLAQLEEFQNIIYQLGAF